jgi:V-type H+-transporting ATPase subunit C
MFFFKHTHFSHSACFIVVFLLFLLFSLIEMFKFEVPSLTVGTLDTLMTLSDEMGKTDQIVESIVRKIEKTAHELSDRSNKVIGHNSNSHTTSSNNPMDMALTVGGVPATRYIQQFAWDSAKYPSRRPLKELVTLIAGGVSAFDEELKQLMVSYTEKTTSLMEAKRRKGGNLLAADLNEVLTPDIMSNITVTDTEYLKTIFIAIPKSGKEIFESTIYKLGNDLVGYGGPDWTSDPTKLGEPIAYGTNVDRHKFRGSPVVPGSLQKVHMDDDSILYTITILKGQYEAGYYENDEFQQGTKINFVDEFTRLCKEKRYVVRENFTWDPTYGTKGSMILEQLQVEVDGMKLALSRWCKNHFGDSFVAWMHIKVIRVFVESVLRYGLPVDFTAVLYKVLPNKDEDLIKALDKYLGNSSNSVMDDKDKEEDGGEEFHEFVMLRFDP